jgi:hypothetical protein
MSRAMIWKLMPFVLAVLVLVFNSVAMAQSPGDTAGFTQYTYQCNGSTGHRIVLDANGTVHLVWTGGIYPSYRHVYYNCYSNGGFSYFEGTSISRANGDGYCQLAIGDQNRAIVIFNNVAHYPADSIWLAIDGYNCLAMPSFRHVPDRTGGRGYLWPYIARSDNGDYQVVETDTTIHVFAYTHSTDEGASWASLQVVDTINFISPIVVVSPVSNKVCITYTRNHHDPVWAATSDLMYIQSTDGRTWDFSNGLINVTHYDSDNDSITAGYDIDAIYDYNDNLHFVWQAKAQSGSIPYQTKLMHYGVASGFLSQIGETSPPTWPPQDCDFPSNEWHFAKVSLGVQQGTNNLFAVYADFDSTDCSQDGQANGDIYMNYSTDNGMVWSSAINITNSPTPNCASGSCASDEYPSMAERVDANAHIFYECITRGTKNSMLYLPYYVNPIGIDDGQSIPKAFSLSQNYPNPFNAATTISFTLEKEGYVKLTVYGVTGAKIATLAEGRMNAGRHEIGWNATDFSSGIYYYRLTSGKDYLIKKMLVLK